MADQSFAPRILTPSETDTCLSQLKLNPPVESNPQVLATRYSVSEEGSKSVAPSQACSAYLVISIHGMDLDLNDPFHENVLNATQDKLHAENHGANDQLIHVRADYDYHAPIEVSATKIKTKIDELGLAADTKVLIAGHSQGAFVGYELAKEMENEFSQVSYVPVDPRKLPFGTNSMVRFGDWQLSGGPVSIPFTDKDVHILPKSEGLRRTTLIAPAAYMAKNYKHVTSGDDLDRARTYYADTQIHVPLDPKNMNDPEKTKMCLEDQQLIKDKVSQALSDMIPKEQLAKF